MRWPWSSDSSNSSIASGKKDSVTEAIKSTDWSLSLGPREIVSATVLTLGSLGAIRIYKNYLRRIPTTNYVKPEIFRKRSLFGKVTSVGDGDNFRFFHTPGGRLTGWGWLPGRIVPTKREALSAQTLHIRIAGVDAPELAHFGRPAQKFGQEALDWLTSYLLGRHVRAYLYRRDQYDRVVATVFVRKWGLRKDVGLEMLKQGLATVYEAKTGSEFGKYEAVYRAAEERAKQKKVGMWSEPSVWARLIGEKSQKLETPREYKKRMDARENEASGKSSSAPVKK